MECERVWLDWVINRSPVKLRDQDVALRYVSEFLDTAPSETLIPLMTRCRALPEMFRLVRAYRDGGVEAEEIRLFFSDAPRDVRDSFQTLRQRAAERLEQTLGTP